MGKKDEGRSGVRAGANGARAVGARDAGAMASGPPCRERRAAA